MSGFNRINPDVIDLGTTQLTGVTVRLFSSNRSPWDGAIGGTLNWDIAAPYIIGNRVVHEGFIYESVTNHTGSNPFTDTTNRTIQIGTNWRAIDGKDGDIWFKQSGAQSSTLQKVNGTWAQLGSSFASAGIPLVDSASNQLAFSYIAASFRTATIEYYITSPGGNYQRGVLVAVNNGVSVNWSQHGVTEIGTNLGIDFNLISSGTNIEVRYNSSLSPTSRSLFIITRS